MLEFRSNKLVFATQFTSISIHMTIFMLFFVVSMLEGFGLDWIIFGAMGISQMTKGHYIEDG